MLSSLRKIVGRWSSEKASDANASGLLTEEERQRQFDQAAEAARQIYRGYDYPRTVVSDAELQRRKERQAETRREQLKNVRSEIHDFDDGE